MDTKSQVKKLEAERQKINAKLGNLKKSRLVSLGEHWGKKLFHRVHHQVHNYSFAEWKKNYVVVKRNDYRLQKRCAGFEIGKNRDQQLRSNNLRTNFRS